MCMCCARVWTGVTLSVAPLQIELETAQSMQTLVDLDRVKTRMQESADALQVGGGGCTLGSLSGIEFYVCACERERE